MSGVGSGGQLLISIAAGWCAAVSLSLIVLMQRVREQRSEVWQRRGRAPRPNPTENAAAAWLPSAERSICLAPAVCLSYKYLRL